MRKVEVHDYKEVWLEMFQLEAQKLERILGENVIEIHHIGSTAVSGMKAKPIIDLMPVVKDLALVDSKNEQMKEIGYESRGENGIKDRRYFQKGGDNRSHHVHVFQTGNPDIDRHLAFRDYLSEHPVDHKRYSEKKEELANMYPFEMESYIEGKDFLVKEIETKALEWYRKRE
ncbi:GrpB family protein [Pseudalkalibacillus hwajinpoensis]|uniref:GrpB family protein n=2 Tax=Guptibacillus hwajinpoensis TaxID=208199 RepID=A0A4U1MNS5_9BACL|nr:GrpB family protein [Pseudalkalibacillus hwajinpoensis]TKD72667.1 GrpB family protein [Pseudalkalibacillus hwajinpoensis]